MFENQEVQDAWDNILDTMTGVDGGARLVKLHQAIMCLEEQPNNELYRRALSIVVKFSKLIDIANNEEYFRITDV